MTAPDCVAGIEAILPPDREVRPDIAARFAFDIIGYSPGRDAGDVTCPIHVAVCEHDTVAPARATLRHVERAPRGEIRMQPVGHFDIYVGEAFEHNVAEQLAFLAEHVPVTG